MLNRILLALVLILGVSFAVAFKQALKFNDKYQRMEVNYKESVNDNKKLTLAYDELDSVTEAKIKSLSDSLNVKPKFIERVITVTVVDTITDTLYVELEKVDSSNYSFVKDTGCFHVEGILNTSNLNPLLYFTELEYNNEIDYVVYLQRRSWKLGPIKSKFLGRKEAKLETINSCGSSTVKDVKLIKK